MGLHEDDYMRERFFVYVYVCCYAYSGHIPD